MNEAVSYHQVRGALKHFVTIKICAVRGYWRRAQPPSWRTAHCRLSATAYSIYSQLPSVSGELPSIRNLRTRHAVVTRDRWWDFVNTVMNLRVP
jgi:hypothetical protein